MREKKVRTTLAPFPRYVLGVIVGQVPTTVSMNSKARGFFFNITSGSRSNSGTWHAGTCGLAHSPHNNTTLAAAATGFLGPTQRNFPTFFPPSCTLPCFVPLRNSPRHSCAPSFSLSHPSCQSRSPSLFPCLLLHPLPPTTTLACFSFTLTFLPLFPTPSLSLSADTPSRRRGSSSPAFPPLDDLG